MAVIEVLHPGFSSSIQDEGRRGFRKWGVPLSGAMDQKAAFLSNRLLQNQKGAAVMEITLEGPVLRFECPIYFTLTGAVGNAHLEEQELKANTPYKAQAGNLLRIGRCSGGVRTYLAVQGGFQTPLLLNSRSYYHPITPRARLAKGDQLAVHPLTDFEPNVWEIKQGKSVLKKTLKVFPGPELEDLPPSIKENLLSSTFTIAKENNRMAYQLNEYLTSFEYAMITSATLPGTIQLTPSGRLIILMRDAQTTGGYPRVLQLDEASLNRLAQRSTGDQLRFELLD
jgi:biotin-dependent carboxylase-like uncharacterized protein